MATHDARRKSPNQISYEIIPGRFFLTPSRLTNASYGERAEAQRHAQTLLEDELVNRFGIAGARVGSSIVPGGWKGHVNPSLQLQLGAEVEPALVRACASAFGLIWRQDAVGFHPKGGRAGVAIRKDGDTPFSEIEIRRTYETLYTADVGKQATIGFLESGGNMIFINGGDLSDDQFRRIIHALVERTLEGVVRARDVRADFELVETDWSSGNGEDYRRRIRDAGRSDLLDWLDGDARRQAEDFIEGFAQGSDQIGDNPSREG